MKNLKNYNSFNESSSTDGEEMIDMGLDFMRPTTQYLEQLLGKAKAENGTSEYLWSFRVSKNSTFYFFSDISPYLRFKKYFESFNDGSYMLREITTHLNDRYTNGVAISRK